MLQEYAHNLLQFHNLFVSTLIYLPRGFTSPNRRPDQSKSNSWSPRFNVRRCVRGRIRVLQRARPQVFLWPRRGLEPHWQGTRVLRWVHTTSPYHLLTTSLRTLTTSIPSLTFLPYATLQRSYPTFDLTLLPPYTTFQIVWTDSVKIYALFSWNNLIKCPFDFWNIDFKFHKQ